MDNLHPGNLPTAWPQVVQQQGQGACYTYKPRGWGTGGGGAPGPPAAAGRSTATRLRHGTGRPPQDAHPLGATRRRHHQHRDPSQHPRGTAQKSALNSGTGQTSPQPCSLTSMAAVLFAGTGNGPSVAGRCTPGMAGLGPPGGGSLARGACPGGPAEGAPRPRSWPRSAGWRSGLGRGWPCRLPGLIFPAARLRQPEVRPGIPASAAQLPGAA